MRQILSCFSQDFALFSDPKHHQGRQNGLHTDLQIRGVCFSASSIDYLEAHTLTPFLGIPNFMAMISYI